MLVRLEPSAAFVADHIEFAMTAVATGRCHRSAPTCRSPASRHASIATTPRGSFSKVAASANRLIRRRKIT